MKKVEINEQVNVTKIGFRKNLATYPRQIEFRGEIYDFVDAGLRLSVRSSNLIAEILTLSDGLANYILRSDNQGCNWTLLSIAS